MHALSDARRRGALLDANRKHVTEETQRVRELRRKLRERIDALTASRSVVRDVGWFWSSIV